MQRVAAPQYEPEYEPEHEPFPRTLREWRARISDARHFGARTAPPIVFGSDLIHRAVVLAVIALATGTMLATLALPGVSILSHAVGNVAHRFDTPLGPVALPKADQRSVVLSKDGHVIATLAGAENRVVVPLKQIPLAAQQAVI